MAKLKTSELNVRIPFKLGQILGEASKKFNARKKDSEALQALEGKLEGLTKKVEALKPGSDEILEVQLTTLEHLLEMRLKVQGEIVEALAEELEDIEGD